MLRPAVLNCTQRAPWCEALPHCACISLKHVVHVQIAHSQEMHLHACTVAIAADNTLSACLTAGTLLRIGSGVPHDMARRQACEPQRPQGTPAQSCR